MSRMKFDHNRNQMNMESLRRPSFDKFCDVSGVLDLWQSALMDSSFSHYHIQGPASSGKSYLLESTLDVAFARNKSAVFLTPEYFTHSKLLEVDCAQWFFVDDVHLLDASQQSVFVAWLNQCMVHECKVFTTSRLLPIESLCGDVSSRIQSAFMINLRYPEDDAQWKDLIHAFFFRHYIQVPQQVIDSILQMTSRKAERIFPLISSLAHQPLKLTASRIRKVYLTL